MTILRSGTTKQYSENWGTAFGGKKKTGKAKPASSAKKASSGKKKTSKKK